MRCFIALGIEKVVIQNIVEIQNRLKEVCPAAKYVKKESMHMTMRFFKNLDEEIMATFFCDADGMPVEEIGLMEKKFSREQSFAFTSFSVQVDEAMQNIATEFEHSAFNSLLAESPNFKFLIFHAEPFVLGVITSSKARVGLIRTIIIDLLRNAKVTGFQN